MTIYEMRTVAGLRQADVLKDYADKRLTRPDLSKIERGIVEAPETLIAHVARICGCTHPDAEKTAHNQCAHGEMAAYTRDESYTKVDKLTRYNQILTLMRKVDKPMTSREIAYRLGYKDLNAVKPRLTELRDTGRVAEAGTVVDNLTERRVMTWRVTS